MTDQQQPLILGVSPTTGASSSLATVSNQLTLTGSAAAGSTVTVYSGTTTLGTVTANTQGEWTYTTATPLTDGTHAFSVTETSGGVTSAPSASTTVTVNADIASFSPLTDQWSAPITVGGLPYLVENANVSGNAPWAITEVDDHTLQFTLKPGDYWPDNESARTEVSGATLYAPTSTLNISYDLTIQPGLADPSLAWEVIGQMHADDSSAIVASLTQDNPIFSLDLRGADGQGGGDYLAIGADYLPSGSLTPVAINGASGLYISPTPIVRGQSYAIQVQASFQDNPSGFLEVWINGVQVVNYHGPLGYGTSNYWKEGVYEGWTTTQPITLDYANTQVSATPYAPAIASDVVNGNRAMLSGTAEANSTVSIYDGSTLLGSATAAGSGSWSYETGALATGAHSFTATATDSSGKVSPASIASSATIAAVVGPIVTAATVSAVSGEALVGAKLTFTLTMSSAVTITGSPQLTLNNGGVATYASGSGTNTLTFQYTVAAGNSSTSGLTITGMSLPTGAAITDASNNAAILTGANQSFANIIVDTNPVSAPVFVSYTANSNGSFTIKGTAAPNTTVHEIQYVYTGGNGLTLDGTAAVNTSGNWTYTTPSLINGTWNGFTAYDTNSLGDVSATTTNNGGGVSTSDLPSPVILSNDISGGSVTLYGVIPASYGNTGPAGATVLIFDGATQIGSATTTTGGQWTFTSSTLTNGVHTFTVESKNASGSSAPSLPVSITVTAGAAPANPPTNAPVTVAYYLANQAALDAAGNVMISDTAANVSSGIGTLNADSNIVSITLTDSGTPTLNLTAAQALGDTKALAAITNASYNVAVTDTSANISTNFNALNADTHLTGITLSGSGTPTLNLTAAQALGDTKALAAITNASYGVAVTDTSANISANFDALNADAHLTALTLSGSGTPTLNLTAAQALGDTKALAAITNASYGVVITDTGANISADFDELNADTHITSILPEGGSQTLDLTLTQLLNDAHAISLLDPFTITLIDTAADLDKLSSAQIANFAADGLNQIDATDVDLSLTLAQRKALGSNEVSVLQPYSGGTTETVLYNANGGLSTIFYQGVTGQAYTSYTITYASNGSPSSASYSNGMTETWTYNANGTTLVTFTNVTGRSYTGYSALYGANGRPINASYNNGITETWTYNTDGSYSIAWNGITTGTYSSQTSLYGSSNTLIANATNLNSGGGVLSLSLSGETVSAAAGTLSVTFNADTFAVASHSTEAIYATGHSAEVFAFGSGFGNDTLVGFAPSSDILSLKLSMFNGLSSANSAAHNAAILLSDHAMAQSGSSVTITDMSGDVLSLASMTTAMLTKYASTAFKFS